MTAERLLAHYERIADAPDAITRLRRFILDLAVRGKLVPQDANDEPASELLKRLKQERRRREKSKTIKSLKLQYGPISLATNFQLPSRWEKTTVGETCDLQTGATPDRSRPHFFGGDIRWLVSGDINQGEIFDCDGRITRAGLDNSNCKILPSNCVLIALNGQGKTRGTVALLRTEAACNQSLIAIIPLLNRDLTPEYLHLSFKARYAAIRELTGKDERRGLNMRLIECFEIAVPPLAEQHRIVSKVDELMGLCDRLETVRAGREAVRDRLAAASLARLNAPDPETFQADARFALDALPALTTRPDQIKALRQTILNLAVRGKLVPQDPNDEPASELLKRIEKERADLVKKKEIRREEVLDPIRPEEMPFDVPKSWVWSRIGEAVLFTQYGTSKKSHPTEKGVPVLTMGNVQDGLVVWNNEKRIPETSEDLPALYLQKFDLLYNRTNSAELVGKTGIYVGEDGVRTFASYLIRLRPSLLSSSPYFLNMAMNAPEFRETQIVPLIKKQTGQANVNGTALKNMLIPLPPLAEQHRIVAKVDALMALCDRLEASLTATAATRRRLLDALLAEALAPADARELEAAE